MLQHNLDMKKYIILFGRIVTSLAIAILSIKLYQHSYVLYSISWSIQSAACFISGIVFCSVTMVVGSFVWLLLLRGGGVFIDFKKAYIVMGQAQIAKYLPGNVFHYVQRISLGSKVGISTEPAVLSIGAETLIVGATASAIAATGLYFDNTTLIWLLRETGWKGIAVYQYVLITVFLIVSALIILLPSTRSWIYQRRTYLKPNRVVISVLLCFIVFLAYGVLISLLLTSLYSIDHNLHWYQLAWGFALAWVAGFAVLGAPGGIGIREAVFVGLYGHILGEGIAIGLAIILRIMTSAGDLLTYGIAYWAGRKYHL